ncbi:MAG: ATP-binding protein [Desulfosporosinus sp.]|nr:ATP-binding protein [Desulfosporosinus sp.]
MSIRIEEYDFIKSARWLSFLECTALGMQLNLRILSDNGNLEFQSARTCSVCQNLFVDFFPVVHSDEFTTMHETRDIGTEDTVVTYPLGTGLIMVAQECSCAKEGVYPTLKDRASVAAKLITNFLTSFKLEFKSGQRALELSILRQMNHIVLSSFHGDTDALKRSFELILSALIIILEAEGSWVQFENGQNEMYIKGDEFLVNAYLTGSEGVAQQVDISYGQSKCNLGVLTPLHQDQASELVSLMAQECAIILEIDNLFRLFNKQLSKVLGAVNSAILLIDQRKNITYANKAAEKLLNKSFINLVGVPLASLDGPWLPAINSEITYSVSGQMELLKKEQENEDPYWIDWQASPIFEETVIMGWFIMIDDRSDYYRWQSAARRAERFASTSMLVGTLAHELRNPLSAAHGLLQLMERKRDPEQTRSYANLAIREIERVTRLLNEFLILGKPASILTEPLDLVTFIEELLPLLEGETVGTTIQVLFNAEKAEHVRADAGQLTQVILNLVRNAVQSLTESENENGIVKISLAQVDNKVEVCIEDNGMGFMPGVIDQLFTPFFSTKERGTGLGLAVVKAIMHNHDGEIEASNSPRGGAVFTMTLPIAGLEENSVDVALVVKDKILSYSLKKALKALDLRVKVLELSDFENDTISINSVLPKQVIIEGLLDSNKLVKIEELHRLWPEIKIIVLGNFSQKIAKNLKEKGIKILERPFEMTQIISNIRNTTFEATTSRSPIIKQG